MVLGILLADISALLPIGIHVFLIFLIVSNQEQVRLSVQAWAILYLIILTGIKAGAKTLVILGGNAWEINMVRYKIDLITVGIGILILLFQKFMFSPKPKGLDREQG